MLGGSGSIDSRDLAFLPDDPNVILHVEAGQLIDRALFNELRKLSEKAANDFAPNGSTELFNELNDSVETITIGIKAPNSLQNAREVELTGVMRFSHDVMLQDVIPDNLKSMRSAEEEIDGKALQLYKDGVFCQIDERTVAFGDPIGVKKILQRGLEKAALSKEMKAALREADFRQLLTIVAAGMPPSVQELKQFIGFDLTVAIVVNADVSRAARSSEAIGHADPIGVAQLILWSAATSRRFFRHSVRNKCLRSWPFGRPPRH
jgi:hypothetical protein